MYEVNDESRSQIIRLKAAVFFRSWQRKSKNNRPCTWRRLPTNVGNTEKLRRRETGIQSSVHCVEGRSSFVCLVCVASIAVVSCACFYERWVGCLSFTLHVECLSTRTCYFMLIGNLSTLMEVAARVSAFHHNHSYVYTYLFPIFRRKAVFVL